MYAYTAITVTSTVLINFVKIQIFVVWEVTV